MSLQDESALKAPLYELSKQTVLQSVVLVLSKRRKRSLALPPAQSSESRHSRYSTDELQASRPQKSEARTHWTEKLKFVDW